MSTQAEAADRQARRSAQSVFDRPLLIEAGAGTGKTATLVNRIVAWLLTRGWELAAARVDGEDRARIAAQALEATVAITFTDAAAAEMATRVEAGLAAYAEHRLEKLKGFDAGLLELDGNEGRLRARALIASLDRLVIRTIHAWCRRLLARYPVEAGLGADFDVDADASVAERAAHEILEEELPGIYADPMLGRSAMRLAREGLGPEALRDALVGLSMNALPPEELASDGCDQDVIDAMRSMLAGPLDEMLDAFDARDPAMGPLSGHTITALDELRAIRAALSRPENDAAQWVAGVSSALRGAVQARERLSKHWSRQGLQKQDVKRFNDDALVASINQAAPALHAATRTLGALDYEGFDTRRVLLARLYPRMLERIHAEGFLTFGDLLRGVRGLFERNEQVLSEVRRGIDHLLVDEFQDTDALQCSLVEMLAFRGAADERPALFVVGDPKQSIYAWREADLAAYDAFKTRILAEGGEVAGLVVNFRSTAQVLEEVSAVVRPLMIEESGIQPAFQELLPGRDNPEGVDVEHWVSWNDDETKGRENTLTDLACAIEADAIAREMRARHAEGVSFGKMAVLLRSTGKLEALLEAFRDAGVPYVVARDRSYYRRREIVDAAAFVRAILDPGDMVALLAWLRSASVGAPDASLAYLWQAGLPAAMSSLGLEEGALAAARSAIEKAREALGACDQEALGLDLVPRWPELLLEGVETLGALRASFRQDPADVFVEKLRRLSRVEAAEAGRYLAPFRVANLERFFGDLVEALDESRGNAQELLRSLRRAVSSAQEAEEARPETLTAEAVNVLTIHRSKGLDFDEVYVPQLHRGSGLRGGDRSSSAKEREGCWEIKLLGKPSPRSFLHSERDARVAEAEQIRLLYVAMTRARERLVLAGNWFGKHTGGAMIRHLPGREGGHPDLHTLFEEALEGPATSFHHEGARWRFPLAEGNQAIEKFDERDGKAPLDVDALLARSRVIQDGRDEARELRFAKASVPVSSISHESYRAERSVELDGSGGDEAIDDDVAAVAAPREERPRPGLPRLAGSIVHRVLERVDLALPLEDALKQAIRIGPVHAVGIGRREDWIEAWKRAAEILNEVAKGPLPSRFDAIREHILARELPILTRPALLSEKDADVASGVVDLVYRCPTSGRIVVADYKTDLLATKEQALDKYEGQLKAYALALRDAWGLDATPRSELWLLRMGDIVPCPD